MIFSIMFMFFYGHCLNLNKDSLYKFPGNHFKADNATGEWVTLMRSSRKTITQVSVQDEKRQNQIFFRRTINNLEAEVVIQSGMQDPKESGVILKTTKNTYKCGIRIGERSSYVCSDNKNMSVENVNGIATNQFYPIGFSLNADFILFKVNKYVKRVKIDKDEQLISVGFYTIGKTIASFL